MSEHLSTQDMTPDRNDTAEVEALLREAGEARREMGRGLAQRLTKPLAVMLAEFNEKRR